MTRGSDISSSEVTLRFVRDGWLSGAMNMARDEALAISVSRGGEPTLRVYRFGPPAISIGRFQEFPGRIDLEECENSDIEIVRRPTGGLAILHVHDFTYSVILPREGPGPGLKDRYFKEVALGVLQSLSLLGIDAALTSHMKAGDDVSTWCFDRTFGVDLDWRGRKICGSAQKVFSGSVLQHGSLFLAPQADILARLTVSGTEDMSLDHSRASVVTIEEALGKVVAWDEVSEAFAGGFAACPGMSVKPGVLSEDEESTAASLFTTKYNTRDWLGRSG